MMIVISYVRFAFRQWRKHPAFALVAIATLGLGIGASTAIYTLLYQVLLRSVPVVDPEHLVSLRYSGSDTGSLSSRGGDKGEYFSYPMYRNLRDRNSVFDGVIASYQAQIGVHWKDITSLSTSELVSGNYFDVLGVHPVIGRVFTQADDEVPRRNPIVVLSYSGWQNHFGGDPKVLNQTLLVNAHPFTIVGVSQPEFKSVVTGDSPDLFVPIMMKAQITPGWDDLTNPRSRWLQITARLKPGLATTQAEAGVNVLWKTLRREELKSISIQSKNWIDGFVDQSYLALVSAAKGFSPVRDRIINPLLIMGGMAVLLMVIACANVATLLLVRSGARIREMSIRFALGASRGQITRQLLVEGLVLGFVGGAVGIVISPAITSVLLHRLFVVGPNSVMPFNTLPDAWVLTFNFLVAVIVGLVFSVVPAIQFRRAQIFSALKQQLTMFAGEQARLQRVFVAVQMGVSLLLLIAAALFVRSVSNLKEANIGFETDHLLTFTIDPRLAGYDRSQVPALNKRILDSLSALPGLRAVAATDDPELANHNIGGNITIADYHGSDNENLNTEWPSVTPDYLATLNLPLIAGRSFGEGDDRPEAPKLAIVNQTFVHKWMGTPDQALGRHFGMGGGTGVQTDIEIIGVVADSRHTNIREEILPTAYLLLQQNPNMVDTLTYYLRVAGDTSAPLQSVRTAVRTVDASLVLDRFRTMEQQIDSTLTSENATAFLATSFGIFAALLSAVGLYGVLAYSATQRTREIGIRMALGASRGSVIWIFTSEIVKLAGSGIVIALPIAFSGSRFLKTQLFGIVYPDPLILAEAVALIIVVAIAGALIPCLRAARIDPNKALRYE